MTIEGIDYDPKLGEVKSYESVELNRKSLGSSDPTETQPEDKLCEVNKALDQQTSSIMYNSSAPILSGAAFKCSSTFSCSGRLHSC